MKYLRKTSTAALITAATLFQPGLASECIDTDGDGWGWDGTGSCIIGTPQEGACIDTDPANDGWGWNGVTSCRIDPVELTCIDSPPAGDGWGWNGVTSCRLDTTVQAECIDTTPLGDGWGWNGVDSCVISTVEHVDLPQGGFLSPGSFHSTDDYTLFNSFNNQFYSSDTSGYGDVFVLDHSSGDFERISVGVNGAEADNHSTANAISPDGRYIAFSSYATNLPGVASNGSEQIYLYDRDSAQYSLVSADANGLPGNGESYRSVISDDANTIAYYSRATSLVAEQPDDAWSSIYLHNRQTSETVRIPQQATFADLFDMSADGRFVLFGEDEYVIDENGYQHVYRNMSVYDAHQKTTTLLLSVETQISSASISNDGQKIAFQSRAADNNNKRQVFALDRETGEVQLAGIINDWENADTRSPEISPDGNYIAFVSRYVEPYSRVFMRNLLTNKTTVVTVPVDGNRTNGDSYLPRFTADGTKLIFTSEASSLSTQDNDNDLDLFIYSL